MRVWVFVKASKHNELVDWLQAPVVEYGYHMVKCRRSARGLPITVAYEQIRIASEGDVANEFMRGILEDILSDQ